MGTVQARLHTSVFAAPVQQHALGMFVSQLRTDEQALHLLLLVIGFFQMADGPADADALDQSIVAVSLGAAAGIHCKHMSGHPQHMSHLLHLWNTSQEWIHWNIRVALTDRAYIATSYQQVCAQCWGLNPYHRQGATGSYAQARPGSPHVHPQHPDTATKPNPQGSDQVTMALHIPCLAAALRELGHAQQRLVSESKPEPQAQAQSNRVVRTGQASPAPPHAHPQRPRHSNRPQQSKLGPEQQGRAHRPGQPRAPPPSLSLQPLPRWSPWS